MALKDAEIAALKADIPARFQPPLNMGGSLSTNFHIQGAMLAPYTLQGSADPLTSDHAREIAGKMFADNPDASAPFMLTGAQMTRQDHSETSEQKKREKERTTYDLLMDALNQRLAQLDAELAQIDKRLEQIRKRRIELGIGLEAADELERLAATGQLDAANPAHAALLRKAGIRPEEADKRDIRDLIAQRRRDMSREDDTLNDEGNGLLKRRVEVAHEREQVSAALNDVKNATTPEEREQARSTASALLGITPDEMPPEENDPTAEQVDAFYSQTDEIDWDTDSAKIANSTVLKPGA